MVNIYTGDTCGVANYGFCCTSDERKSCLLGIFGALASRAQGRRGRRPCGTCTHACTLCVDDARGVAHRAYLLESPGAEVRQGQGLGSGDKKEDTQVQALSHGSVCVAAHTASFVRGRPSSRSSRRPTQQLPGQAPTPMQRRQWWWPMGRQRLI